MSNTYLHGTRCTVTCEEDAVDCIVKIMRSKAKCRKHFLDRLFFMIKLNYVAVLSFIALGGNLKIDIANAATDTFL